MSFLPVKTPEELLKMAEDFASNRDELRRQQIQRSLGEAATVRRDKQAAAPVTETIAETAKTALKAASDQHGDTTAQLAELTRQVRKASNKQEQLLMDIDGLQARQLAPPSIDMPESINDVAMLDSAALARLNKAELYRIIREFGLEVKRLGARGRTLDSIRAELPQAAQRVIAEQQRQAAAAAAPAAEAASTAQQGTPVRLTAEERQLAIEEKMARFREAKERAEAKAAAEAAADAAKREVVASALKKYIHKRRAGKQAQAAEAAAAAENEAALERQMQELFDTEGSGLGVPQHRPRMAYTVDPRNGRLGKLIIDMPRLLAVGKTPKIVAYDIESGKPVLSAPADQSLIQLLTKRWSSRYEYTPEAIATFRQLVTKAHLPPAPLSEKFRLLTEPATVGTGAVPRFYSDPVQLMQRAEILAGEIDAGNDAPDIAAELANALDALARDGVVDHKTYASIARKYLS